MTLQPPLKTIEYFPETGIFNRIKKTSNNCKLNDVAITKKNGYQYIMVNNGWRLAHRLAFQQMGVEIPDSHVVDHKNGDRADNRWDNLRLLTPSENNLNSKAKNIYYDKRKDAYYVQIGYQGKTHSRYGKSYDQCLILKEQLIDELGIRSIKCQEE
jgi:hypothetical protein